MKAPAVPILTWHSMHVSGPGYADNDHLAFREDLEWLHGAGLRIVPLHEIARALREGRVENLVGCVGLSMDDGSDFDYHDVPHPALGPQRGMARILEDFKARHGPGVQPGLHATAFTIVSPSAREELDRTCMIGCRWWNHDWYRAAEATGLMSIESHGWDHNHPTLRSTATTAPSGAFDIRVAAEAEVELGEAARLLRTLRGRDGDVLFAYPYGDVSDFLARDWLPANGGACGLSAAFTTQPEPVTAGSSHWRVPRYVFGEAWKSPGELAAILRDAGLAPSPRSAARTPLPKPTAGDWRDRLRTWEVNDASVVAGPLFKRSFGQDVPAYPRHFVLVHSPEPGSQEPPVVVAYIHQTPRGRYALSGGLCVDERAYRRFPRWLFEAVRNEGGLATLVNRDSAAMLGDGCVAAFAHVGEPRSRAALLRVGYVEAERPPLMVLWRMPLPQEERARLVEEVAALGPF